MDVFLLQCHVITPGTRSISQSNLRLDLSLLWVCWPEPIMQTDCIYLRKIGTNDVYLAFRWISTYLRAQSYELKCFR